MSYRGVGHVIFSLPLGVGHSVLPQLEGVGHVFSNHHISKCSSPHPPPPPVLFDQSLTDIILFVLVRFSPEMSQLYVKKGIHFSRNTLMFLAAI